MVHGISLRFLKILSTWCQGIETICDPRGIELVHLQTVTDAGRDVVDFAGHIGVVKDPVQPITSVILLVMTSPVSYWTALRILSRLVHRIARDDEEIGVKCQFVDGGEACAEHCARVKPVEMVVYSPVCTSFTINVEGRADSAAGRNWGQFTMSGQKDARLAELVTK